MKLSALVSSVPGARLLGEDVEVRTVTSDSRAVAPGDLFVAVRGRRADGHAFVRDAVARGAAAIAVEHPIDGVGLPQLIVDSGERALGRLIARRAGDPGNRMTLIAITGTNGKTTSTYLIESVLVAAGAKVGVIGTVSYRWNGRAVDAPYTTPTPEVLTNALAEMAAAGCTHVVMETTSAALVMHRLAGLHFQVAAFTNLTQDHLDLHGSMEAYRAAKELLFRDYLGDGGTAVVNVDDPAGRYMIAAAGPHRVLEVSVGAAPDAGAASQLRVVEHTSTVDGIRAHIRTPRGALALTSRPLIGSYNVANIALAVGVGEALSLPHEAIIRGIAGLAGVPGRVERVANSAGLDIVVDYAHTPDALDNLLRTLRPLTRRRLICVFGCGGDRDPLKRPKMGQVVAELADLAVVTSDNPRTEDPRAILEAILVAVPSPFFVDVDRRTAIRVAIAEATPGDVVVIAGKGHEDYQILGTTKIHFDDREEAAAAADLRPRWSMAELASAAGGDVHVPAAGGERFGAAGSATDSGSASGSVTGAVARSGSASVPSGSPVIARVTIDGRNAAPGDLYVAITGQRFDGHGFIDQAVGNGAAAVMVSRGRVPPHLPAIEVTDPLIALGQIAGAHREAWARNDDRRRLVAITGSAGKTTTKELVRAGLSAAALPHAAPGSLNNETGVPLTLLGLREHHRFAVIEMGMRGPGQIEYLTRFTRPDVAVVVNAGTAHIELLGSTDAIAAAKAEIWLGLPTSGVAVAPGDDERLLAWTRTNAPSSRLITFGEAASADVRLVSYHPHGADGADLHVDALGRRRRFRLPMIGRHSAIDATCALAAVLACGVELELAIDGLERARPAAMRSEVASIGGRHVIVDCYNANPSSMAAAIDTLAELRGSAKAVAVVGDMLELGDHAEAAHAEVGERLGELGIPVVALGSHRTRIADAAKAMVPTWTMDDPAAAARQVLAMTEPGDWVLIKASRGMRLERVVAALAELAV